MPCAIRLFGTTCILAQHIRPDLQQHNINEIRLMPQCHVCVYVVAMQFILQMHEKYTIISWDCDWIGETYMLSDPESEREHENPESIDCNAFTYILHVVCRAR